MILFVNKLILLSNTNKKLIIDQSTKIIYIFQLASVIKLIIINIENQLSVSL